MPAKQSPELSPLELEVMNVIWDRGECTSADVIRDFAKKRKLANTTIRTVLANIRKKGFRPRVSKRSVARRSVRALLRNMFGDSPREAIEFLLEEEDIDQAELDEIRKLLDEHATGGEEE
jgi:BlaI family penicillinase repressor